MRRTFLRTPGSPQASVTVETPAHYARTLLLQIGSLSEVVIGSVEPNMSCAPYETRRKYSTFSLKLMQEIRKNDRNGTK